jgi:hypothetical protein
MHVPLPQAFATPAQLEQIPIVEPARMLQKPLEHWW